MYRYRDYFPRSVLKQCGVSPDLALKLPDAAALPAEKRRAEVEKGMAEIYSVFLRGATEKVGQNAPSLLDGLRLDERIVSAFYDADVLKEGDRAIFPENYPIDKSLSGREEAEQKTVAESEEERIGIEVPESEDVQAESSQKVEEVAPPQRGKTLS